jgi:hypothetical protein
MLGSSAAFSGHSIILMPSSSAGCAVTAFAGKADIARSFEMSAFNPKPISQTIFYQRPSVSLRLSAWCPKGQFISRRVDVKIGGIGEHGG